MTAKNSHARTIVYSAPELLKSFVKVRLPRPCCLSKLKDLCIPPHTEFPTLPLPVRCGRPSQWPHSEDPGCRCLRICDGCVRASHRPDALWRRQRSTDHVRRSICVMSSQHHSRKKIILSTSNHHLFLLYDSYPQVPCVPQGAPRDPTGSSAECASDALAAGCVLLGRGSTTET